MRSRNIKPGFFTNEVLGSAEPLLGTLFQGLWCMADREGRLEDRPLRICAKIFPYRRKLNEQVVDKMLTWLDEQNFIRRYVVAGRQFIQVLEFGKHQRPHSKEAPSIIPALTSSEHRPRSTPGAHLGGGEPALIPDSGFLIPDSPPPEGKNQEPPHPTAEPVGRGLVDTGGPGRRRNGTSPRDRGTNPRNLGTNPRREQADARTINAIAIQAWARACELIDEIHGVSGRTWAEVVDPKFPYMADAIRAAGGHKDIALRDRYTTARLKADFCTGYRIACEDAPRDTSGPTSVGELLAAKGPAREH